MDKQTQTLLGATFAILGITVIVLLAMWNYSPAVEPSPFEPNTTATPTPTLTPTPTPSVAPTPTPTPNHIVEVNETTDPNATANMTYCDDRLPASLLYERGCYGGSSGSAPNVPQSVIPELPTWAMVTAGLLAIGMRRRD